MTYLTAWGKVLALGKDALVVVDIILPAVLCPRDSSEIVTARIEYLCGYILVLVGKPGVEAWQVEYD